MTFGIAVLLIGASTVIKYTWPMRRMREAEVSKKTLAIGAVLGVIGFFVVPVLGLVLGFVLGVYRGRTAARHDARRAWVSTLHALKGVALSVGIELIGALGPTVAWAVAVLTLAISARSNARSARQIRAEITRAVRCAARRSPRR